MSEDQIQLLQEIKDLFETQEKHPEGLPNPVLKGSFFQPSASSYYHDAEQLCDKVIDLKKSLGDDSLFDGAALNSTRFDEVQILSYCNAKTPKNEVIRYMKVANDHLFRDLDKVQKLINDTFKND